MPLLPLKLRYVAGVLPFCGFSCNRLLCGAIAAGTSRRKYCREWSGSIVFGYDGGGGGGDVGGRVLPLPLVVELVIFGFRKKKNASG
jgi:hypothetical protein